MGVEGGQVEERERPGPRRGILGCGIVGGGEGHWGAGQREAELYHGQCRHSDYAEGAFAVLEREMRRERCQNQVHDET